jgi:hypothetical protein
MNHKSGEPGRKAGTHKHRHVKVIVAGRDMSSQVEEEKYVIEYVKIPGSLEATTRRRGKK